MWSTGVGSAPARGAMPEVPATGAMAAICSGMSRATRYVIIAPLENPVA